MSLGLHHIFVCTNVDGPEAKALRDAGLVEGSSNIHPGQGTANRRFFFESGFLELLWVHDEIEAQSALTAPTQLWERWAGRGRTTNPFGICFSSAEGTDSGLPFACWAYQPEYLSAGRSIQFADRLSLAEPEIFALSWPQVQSSPRTEPTRHPLGLCDMRSVSVGLPDPAHASDTLSEIRDAGLLSIHHSSTPELIIGFRSQREVKLDVPALGLSLRGQPANAG